MAYGRKTGGGSRKGKRNKSHAEYAAIIEKIIPFKEQIKLLAELARGVTVEERMGEMVRTYTKPPDVKALTVLIEHTKGKAPQPLEHSVSRSFEDFLKGE